MRNILRILALTQSIIQLPASITTTAQDLTLDFLTLTSPPSLDPFIFEMSFLKKPLKKLKDLHPGSSATNSSDGEKSDGVATPRSGTFSNGTRIPDQKRHSRGIFAADKMTRHEEIEQATAEAKKRQSMAKIEDEKFLKEGPPQLTALYRPYSMNMSKNWNHEHRILFKDLDFASKFITLSSISGRVLTSSQRWTVVLSVSVPVSTLYVG